MNPLGIAQKLRRFHHHFFGLIFLGMGAASLILMPGVPSGVLGIGFLVVGIFFLTVARVELEETELKYLRFSRWHAVAYSEIEACGEDSRLGYVKLRHYVFPWGKLYFALPNSSESFWGKDTSLLTAIREKANSA